MNGRRKRCGTALGRRGPKRNSSRQGWQPLVLLDADQSGRSDARTGWHAAAATAAAAMPGRRVARGQGRHDRLLQPIRPFGGLLLAAG